MPCSARAVAALTGVLISILLAVAPQAAVAAPEPGLVSWWKADGNPNDSVGPNNGILKGTQPGSGWYVSGPPGDPGQAFNLNGSDDYVDVPNNPTQNITGSISRIELAGLPRRGLSGLRR